MPEPLSTPPALERPRKRRLWLTGGVVVAVAVVIAGVIGANRTAGSSYRTAAVERGDVDSTLDATGTIQSLNQADLSFPVAGSVRSVPVAVGQHVTVGQTLAQLDTTDLDAQVASAQATVAAAQARLVSDGQSQTAADGVAPAAFIQRLTPADPATTRQLVTEQQARLVADQHRADQDLAREQHDLTPETSLCQAFLASAGAGGTTGTTGTETHRTASPAAPTTSQSPTPKPSAGSSSSAGAPDASGCESALTKVLADQEAVSQDQHTLAADLPALDDAVDKLVAVASARSGDQPLQNSPQPAVAGQAPTPAAASDREHGAPAATPGGAGRSGASAGSPAAGAGRAGSSGRSASSGLAGSSGRPASSGRSASSGRPASAEQLAADQAAIDAAQAQLTVALQTHDQAELLSPISGTVGAVTIAPGQSVQGGSGTGQIIVIGPGSQEVTTTITDTDIDSLRVGDAATVTPSGGTTPLRGQVVSVGLLAASGSTSASGSVSYPVTIGLTNTGQQLFDGQSAAVSITLAHASDALTVPSSAVHTVGAGHAVTVLRSGSPTDVRVTVGTTGPIRTQVLSGLSPGDQVVLADLSRALPTTEAGNVRRAVGGGGGGGGRPGG